MPTDTDEGVTQMLIADSPEAHANGVHSKILGGGKVGTHAGDMIVERQRWRMGSCTDLPPARK